MTVVYAVCPAVLVCGGGQTTESRRRKHPDRSVITSPNSQNSLPQEDWPPIEKGQLKNYHFSIE
jgi:hypothetical protein